MDAARLEARARGEDDAVAVLHLGDLRCYTPLRDVTADQVGPVAGPCVRYRTMRALHHACATVWIGKVEY